MADQRRPLISGNWKMHLNHFEAMKLVQELSYQVTRDDIDAVDVSVHPPFTDIRTVQTTLESDRIPFFLGAQHCHSDASGAFTGEVAPPMLAKLGVTYVIVGHSERREVFGESDELINAKVRAILANEMTPILCVGETLEEREADQAQSRVEAQLAAGLTKVSPRAGGRHGDRLRADLGHRDGPDRLGRRCPGHVRRGPGRGGVGQRRGRGGVGADPVRRLGEADQRRRAHGSARYRRRPGRRSQPRGGVVRPHHPVPTPRLSARGPKAPRRAGRGRPGPDPRPAPGATTRLSPSPEDATSVVAQAATEGTRPVVPPDRDFAGSPDPEDDGPAEPTPGTLVWVVETEPPDLHVDDPANGLTTAAWIRQGLLESLFGVGPDLSYHPELLADEPTVTPGDNNSVTIDYRLRSGLTWSDGTPLTAQDVAYTHRILVEGCTVEADGSIADDTAEGCIYRTGNRIGLDQVTDFEVISDTEFRITMASFYPDWRRLYSPVLAAHAHGEDADVVNRRLRTMIGLGGPLPTSGPLRLERWDRGLSMTLVPNEVYHGTTAPGAGNDGPPGARRRADRLRARSRRPGSGPARR